MKVSLNSSDESIVSDLIVGKEEAWIHLSESFGDGLSRYKKELSDFSLGVDDLFNEACLCLQEDDCRRLRRYQVRGWSLTGLMFYTIIEAKKRLLYKFRRDRDAGLSDEVEVDALQGQVGESRDEHDRRVEQREALNRAFLILWRSKPQMANIYLMREKLEMPSKQVAAVLNVAVNTVDVTVKRAKSELKNLLLKDMEYDQDSLFNEK